MWTPGTVPGFHPQGDERRCLLTVGSPAHAFATSSPRARSPPPTFVPASPVLWWRPGRSAFGGSPLLSNHGNQLICASMAVRPSRRTVSPHHICRGIWIQSTWSGYRQWGDEHAPMASRLIATTRPLHVGKPKPTTIKVALGADREKDVRVELVCTTAPDTDRERRLLQPEGRPVPISRLTASSNHSLRGTHRVRSFPPRNHRLHRYCPARL
jgi:hypothetical protein